MQLESVEFAARLLRSGRHLDIVVGDYGRDAAIRYLALASAAERTHILNHLAKGQAFFDEYRRIVYSAHLEVVEHKAVELADYSKHGRALDSGILIGLSGRSVSSSIRQRILATIVRTVEVNLHRSFDKVRVILPCNTLSGLLTGFKEATHEPGALQELLSDSVVLTPAVEKAMRYVEYCPLVDTVVGEIARHFHREHSRVVVLGTAETNSLYSNAFAAFNISVAPLAAEQIDMIDGAVMACIGGDEGEVSEHRRRLQADVIGPSTGRYGKIFVLEACTDFNFDIGTDALSVFAQTMVDRCYAEIA